MSFTNEKYPESFHQLFTELQAVRDHIQQKNLEHEAKNQFYHTINDHIATGVICFDASEHILLMNKAACRILGMTPFRFLYHLKDHFPELYQIFTDIQSNNSRTCKLWVENKARILSIQSTRVIVPEGEIKVVSFQDIKNEMDEKEMEAWQKLIRVIAHEIMNSIAPITSLSETLLKYYAKDEGYRTLNELSAKHIENTVEGLMAIKERGMELSKFVDLYRQLTRIPPPIVKTIVLKEFFNQLTMLTQSMQVSKIEVCAPEGLTIQADSGLLMQVLINIVKNADEAIENKSEGSIRITAEDTGSGPIITIADNGNGIESDVLENIFLPYFTTKENGSGIGLSFSQQVMRMHGGKILVESKQGVGTEVKLCF